MSVGLVASATFQFHFRFCKLPLFTFTFHSKCYPCFFFLIVIIIMLLTASEADDDDNQHASKIEKTFSSMLTLHDTQSDTILRPKPHGS